MKALVKKFPERGLWLEDVPEPKTGANDVKIKIHKTAICGTDLHIYNWDAWSQKTIKTPQIIGHEYVGEIVEVGSNVTSWRVGELVSGEGDSGVYKAISEPAYLRNPEKIAKNVSSANSGGFKGLATQDVYDAHYLGAESLLIEADMSRFILPEYTEGAINFYFEGNSYYFNKEEAERLDKLTREADALGMKIYIRTTLRYPEKDEDGIFVNQPIEALYSSLSSSSKQGYLPSLNGEGGGYVKAFYAFLASRYGKNSALDYIIGENVNNHALYCYAGEIEAEAFVAEYYSWARCAANVLKSYEQNAKVHISLDNVLRNDGAKGAIGTKIFLNAFAAHSSDSANWNYGIALNLGNGSDISDVLSGKIDSYTYIGVNNLSDLCDLLDKPEHQYVSERRSIIIDNLSLPTTVSEKNRAAYYSYAYYRAKEAGYGAMFYNCNGASDLYSADGKRSDLYYACLLCGSSITEQLKGYTSGIPGKELPSFSDHTDRKLTYEQAVQTSVGESVLKKKNEFPIGFGDFKTGGSCVNLDIASLKSSDGTLSEKITLGGNIKDSYAAMTATGVSAKEIIGSGYVGITMSASQKLPVALIISDTSSGAAYVGEATVSDKAGTYYFNITSFTENIDSSDTLQISLCVLHGDADATALTVSDISLYGSSGNGSQTVVVVIIVVVVVLALIGLIVLLAVSRKKKLSREH